MKPDSSTIQVKLRKYSDSQRKFLKTLTDKLLEMDLIYRNTTSKWGCAPHLVRKPEPEEWRFTVVIRPVNKMTYPIKFPLPNMEHELDKAKGARHYA